MALRASEYSSRAAIMGGVAELAVAEPTEEVLADVGDGLDFAQADAAGGALDGVDDAENDVQRIWAGPALFQGRAIRDPGRSRPSLLSMMRSLMSCCWRASLLWPWREGVKRAGAGK